MNMKHVSILGVLVSVALVGCGEATTGESPPASSNSPVAAVSTSPSPSPAGAKVLLDRKGSGIYKTAKFITKSDWTITWSYDCTKFGYSGNFIVTVYDGSSNVVDLAVNELGKKGGETANEYNLSGPYYLQVNSECSWRVIVKS